MKTTKNIMRDSYIFQGKEYTRQVLRESEVIKLFYKDEDDEAALVKDEYGQLWLYYTRWEEVYSNQETYYSSVKDEEDAESLYNQQLYWERHRCPCFSMSSYGMFRLDLQ